ncbi:hypothetical protein [uncultured Pontibacter sp.]|uniref:hypothetical protein n=1 Tax=uncultured Pontibacter sp. TaxID=453356 RepID=UPI0026111BC4|nr:hypothetical protein [uncultured Pontibacter sp.]
MQKRLGAFGFFIATCVLAVAPLHAQNASGYDGGPRPNSSELEGYYARFMLRCSIISALATENIPFTQQHNAKISFQYLLKPNYTATERIGGRRDEYIVQFQTFL